MLDIVGGVLTYTAGTGVNNHVTIESPVNHRFTLNDTAETITVGAAALAAGFVGSGTNTVTGPEAAATFSSIAVNLADGTDTLTLGPIVSPISSLSITDGGTSGDAATIVDPINVAGRLSMTGFSSIMVIGTVTTTNAINLRATALTVGQTMSSANAPIALTANTMTIGASINAGTSAVALAPIDPSETIDLGTNSVGNLGLTNAELDFVTARFLDIGTQADTGATQVTAAINGTGHYSNMFLDFGSGIADTGAGSLKVGQLDMAASPVPTTNVGSQAHPLQIAATGLFATTQADTGNIFLAATGSVTIVGTAPSGGLSAGAGTITLSAGTFNLSANNQITDSQLVLSGATLNLSGFSDTVRTLSLSNASVLEATINGVGAGQFGNLTVDGAISLGNATLKLSLGRGFRIPPPGTTLPLIINLGHALINGQFGRISSGSTINVGGHNFSLTYFGGTTGEDEILTSLDVQ